ncbi:MAG: cysteine desulfurase [Oscillospiraceae bacterium]|nr:cysteine desulfurase [Oscillospiraceae bacterium]
MIYFDNAATTKVCPAAAEAALRAMTVQYGNPSSGHALGREAAALLESSRESLAEAFGAKSEEIFFTSGGTESDNWALRGAAQLMRHKGKHIISSKVEHEAVLKTLEDLAHLGFEVEYLDPEQDGSVSAEKVYAAVREDTILVSLMTVNNETGAQTDIAAVSKAVKAKAPAALVHTDAVQAFMKLPLKAKEFGADLISVSAHKVHAPKGAGALYIKQGVKLKPLIFGGGQEKGLRSGTEAMPQICAFAAAVEEQSGAIGRNYEKAAEIREKLVSELKKRFDDVVIIAPAATPYILTFSVPGYRSETLMSALDGEGICVSKGSACKRGARSHVLEAMKLPPRVIDGAIRLSFSGENTLEEAGRFAEVFETAAKKLFRR